MPNCNNRKRVRPVYIKGSRPEVFSFVQHAQELYQKHWERLQSTTDYCQTCPRKDGCKVFQKYPDVKLRAIACIRWGTEEVIPRAQVLPCAGCVHQRECNLYHKLPDIETRAQYCGMGETCREISQKIEAGYVYIPAKLAPHFIEESDFMFEN